MGSVDSEVEHIYHPSTAASIEGQWPGPAGQVHVPLSKPRFLIQFLVRVCKWISALGKVTSYTMPLAGIPGYVFAALQDAYESVPMQYARYYVRRFGHPVASVGGSIRGHAP